MHQSSSLTIFIKYFYPIVVGAVFTLILVDTDPFSTDFLTILMLGFVLTGLYISTLGKLRHVKANHDQIITNTLRWEETIDYREIEYVYQIAMIRPILIGIKYRDKETGQFKKFYTMASLSERFATINVFNIEEVELTKFIRRKITAEKPYYDGSNEPSRWKPIIIFMLSIFLSILIGNVLTV